MKTGTQMNTTKSICDIKEYENYRDYYVTIDGQVFSTKYKKPKPIKPNNVGKYQTVRLSDGNKTKTFYLHRLVALAFLPKPTNSGRVVHIDGNKHNNNVNNLKWYMKQRVKRKPNTSYVSQPLCKNVEFIDENSLIVNEELSNYIRKIHRAAIRKGIGNQDVNIFFRDMLKESIENYLNQYGLKKIMIQIDRGL